MTIMAHAPVPPEARLDVADTLSMTLPPTHPLWCSGDDCAQPWGDLFHTRTVAELEAVDADLVAVTPVTLDVWLEAINDAAPQIQLVTTPLGQSTFRAGLTPVQAAELGRALLLAVGMAAEVGDGS